jgi:exodeoxyribonuclease V alpha subunit
MVRVPDQVPLDASEVIDGVVDHLLHVSFDERTVLRLTATTGGEESITALGKALFGVRPGESLRLHGAWVHHPRHGRQFRAERCERTMPADERAIRLYLASGMIRGIGPILASAIVDAFGEQTLKVIDAEPQRLLEVHGIGQVRLGRITAAWQEQKAIAEIMVFLQGLQITPALAVKIYTAYADTGDDPMHVVRRTPYRLCRDVRGVGFVNADKIALAVVPMISAAGMMLLQRNLLYTAVTRARNGAMLIGQSEAVERAIANNRTQRRNTALTHRIHHAEAAVPALRAHTPSGQLTWD